MTLEERRIRHNELNTAWRAKNPNYFKKYAAEHSAELKAYYAERHITERYKNPDGVRLRSRESRHKLKLQVIKVLGGRCANLECRWVNPDMTLGCTDTRLLEVDHIDGGGRKEVEEIGYHVMMRRIRDFGAQGKYQLLCRCCNHLKRIKNGENGKGKSENVTDCS